MKFIRWILVTAFLFSNSLSLAQLDTAELLQQPYSMITKSMHQHAHYQIEIPQGCSYKLKQVMAKGGSLVSQEILKRSVVIEDFPRDDVKDREFYHYTDAFKALDAIVANKSYSDIYTYLRDNKRSYYEWQFYVAGDSESSRSYGSAGYRVILKPKTLMFFIYGDTPGAPVAVWWEDVAKAVTKELLEKYPSLYECDFVQGTDTHILTYLAAEASGVGAIVYKGTGNRFGGNAYNAQWLQIITPSAIESMERFK
jgi:hypothetical protein